MDNKIIYSYTFCWLFDHHESDCVGKAGLGDFNTV